MNQRSMLRPLAWLPIFLALAWGAMPAFAEDDTFVVGSIEVIGLQRITEGTLFNYLPVSIGDTLTPERSAQALRALFATQFFRDVEFRRDGDTLVIVVVERPTIARFTVEGNRDISDDDLRAVLRGVGLAEGRIFDRGVLENVQVELRRQYFNRGKYGVRVDTEVNEIGDDLVEIEITIAEGQVARIRDVNFVGNDSFPDGRLAREMELRRTNWLSFYRRDDQYSREKLQGDLEALRSFYMDQGYATFEITSVQVAISPDKRDMFVTVNLVEGEPYRVGAIRLAGNLIVPEDQLTPLLLFQTGQTFNRRAVTTTGEWIQRRLGEEGYANAEVTPLPEFDEENNVVDITLFVDPGSRVYVRRINFSGGDRTDDETFRREMRQLEGAWLQSSAVERSKTRLQRLPFVEEVNIDTRPVPGTPDLVDVDVAIKEREPGHFQFGLGYSSAYGAMVNAGITHSNWLGRGNRLQLDLNRSEFSENYNLSFTNPFHTVDGISRTWGVFYRSADQLFARGSPMFINAYGGNLGYGIPLSEFMRIDLGVTLSEYELMASFNSTDYVQQWVQNPDHGRTFERFDPADPFSQIWGVEFRLVELNTGFVWDTRNRAIFPTRGSRRGVQFDVSVPPGDVTYYMGTLFDSTFVPVGREGVFASRIELTAGRGYADTVGLPPYRFIFAGGSQSVRGYRENWLGPRDETGFPVGGNVRIVGQFELMIPPPMERLRNSTRVGVFYDIGNVFLGRDDVSLDELRMSVGLGATWLAPVGAIRISYAYPLNDKPGDRLERFQFTLGSAF